MKGAAAARYCCCCKGVPVRGGQRAGVRAALATRQPSQGPPLLGKTAEGSRGRGSAPWGGWPARARGGTGPPAGRPPTPAPRRGGAAFSPTPPRRGPPGRRVRPPRDPPPPPGPDTSSNPGPGLPRRRVGAVGGARTKTGRGAPHWVGAPTCSRAADGPRGSFLSGQKVKVPFRGRPRAAHGRWIEQLPHQELAWQKRDVGCEKDD